MNVWLVKSHSSRQKVSFELTHIVVTFWYDCHYNEVLGEGFSGGLQLTVNEKGKATARRER